MTITSTTTRTEFNGDDGTVDFTVTYRVYAASDLLVYEDTTLKTITTHYTVALSGDPAGSDGAVVTFLSAPQTGTANVIIARAMPKTQGVNFPVGGKFPADSAEEADDRAILITQELWETILRSLRASLSIPTADLTQTTVGSAGGGSALPATPTGYVVITITGVGNVVVPYYDLS